MIEKRKLKKILIVTLLISLGILSTLLFFRYNNQKNEEITLIYWGIVEDEKTMNKLIEEYQIENPNINIEYSQRRPTDYDNFLYTRLEQFFSQGTPAADIVSINNTWLPKYEKYLQTLPKNIMSREKYIENFYPISVKNFTGSDNNLYAIPIGIDGLAIFYNKDILSTKGYDSPPNNWDSLISVAKALTIKDENGNITQAGLAMGSTNNITYAPEIISFLILQNNTEILTKTKESEKEIMRVNLTNTNAQESIDFYKSFVDNHSVWSADLHRDIDMFSRGNLAMFFAPSSEVLNILKNSDDLNFDLHPLPQLGAVEPVNYAMYWGEAVSKTSKHPNEAWKFLEFLSSRESLKKLYNENKSEKGIGQPYPLKSLSEELNNEKYVYPVMKMIPNMKSWDMGQNPKVREEFKNIVVDSKKTEENINVFLESL